MRKHVNLISVIIPVYNVKPYLEECVNSVLVQTYDNLEIILVDDGSTDGSGELCEKLKEKDTRILVIHKANAGLGFARNSALEIFAGKYVTFIDSDDYVSPSMIENLYNGLMENEVDECKMGFQRVKDNHIVCGEKKYEKENFSGIEAKTTYAPRIIGSAPDKHDSIEMSVWGTLFVGDIIRKYNLRFPSERELLSEDLFFHLEYLQKANGACLIDKMDYKYRVNEKSLTKSYRVDRADKSLSLYNELVKRLRAYGYGESVINRARRIFFIYILMSITQEVMYEKNNMVNAIKNIKKICSNDEVQNIIKAYPVNELEFKQRMFLKCIIHRMGFTLYALKKCGAY